MYQLQGYNNDDDDKIINLAWFTSKEAPLTEQLYSGSSLNFIRDFVLY